MAEILVIDTGPLITLARIGALGIIGRLPYEFICPQEIRIELDKGATAGYQAVEPPWLKAVPLERPLSPLLLATLDEGEAAVIQLALEQGITRVVIDDWKGRRAALAANLKITGSLGILGKAKQLGLITVVRPFVERAVEEGIYYHPELLRKILAAFGE